MDPELEKKITGLQDEFKKLLTDERTANDKKLEGLMPAGDFKTFSAKLEARMVEINTEIAKLKVPVTHAETKGNGVLDGKAEYKKNFFQFMRTGVLELGDKAHAYNIERKALVADATGQILIPEEIEAEIMRVIPQVNVLRPYCAVRSTTRDRIRLRSLTEVQVGWGKLELGAAAPETTMVPGETWQYVEDSNGLTKVGNDELADTDTALEPLIADSFARAFADQEEEAFLNGTGHGTEQPSGILLAASGVATHALTAAGAVTVDDILHLIYALPSKYRANGTFFMNSGTELLIRLLRATTFDATHFGAYIWQPSVQAGKPATLCGYPEVACDAMPEVGDGALQKVVLFGDLRSGYRILDRAGMSIQRLLELYATAGLVGFLANRRVGGSVVRADAMRILVEP